jgi:hypothetical protein
MIPSQYILMKVRPEGLRLLNGFIGTCCMRSSVRTRVRSVLQHTWRSCTATAWTVHVHVNGVDYVVPAA